MADDIDIEEHMFPEFTQIKTEVEDFEDEDTGVENNRLQYESEDEVETHNFSIYRLIYDNQRQISEEPTYPQIGNKIILGSKPQRNVDTELLDDKLNKFRPTVVLENWGPCLESSTCYCKECKILFATDNVFDAHKMVAHSFLVAIGSVASKNVAVKSTSKGPYKNVKVDQPTKNKAVKSTAKSGIFMNDVRNKATKSTAKASFNTVGDIPRRKAMKSTSKVDYSYISSDSPNNKAVKSATKVITANIPLKSPSRKTFNNTTSRNKAVKKTIVVEKAKVGNKVTEEANPNSFKKMCTHCNQYFSDDDLVKHLYDLLPVKAFSCDKCDKIFNNKADLTAHYQVHKSKNIAKKHDSRCLMYICPVCTCKFSHTKYLNVHLMRNHNIKMENTKIENYNGKCELCGTTYKSYKSFNIHIKKYHSKYYLKNMKMPMKNSLKGKIMPVAKQHSATKTIKKPKTSKNKVLQYQCLVCKEIFSNHDTAREHRYLKHPEMKNQRVIKRIGFRSHKQNGKKTSQRSRVIDNLPIPKATLFKCDKCPVHFLTCFRTNRHARHCVQSLDGTWKCEKCSRVFTMAERELHLTQHQHSTKFKVFVAHAQLRDRILCKCPECGVYFDDIRFWKHSHRGCLKKSRSILCTDCNLQIYDADSLGHEAKHETSKYARDDFIKIDFVLINKTQDPPVTADKVSDQPSNQPKRKLSTDSDFIDIPTKKRKLFITKSHKIRLYYCSICKCCMQVRTAIHKEPAQCKNLVTTTCKICGLTVTTKGYLSHKRLHLLHNLKLNDFELVRIQDSKIVSPMPRYYKCNRCAVHVENRRSLKSHECGKKNPKSCKICGKKFNEKAFEFHLSFHDYSKKVQNKKCNLDKKIDKEDKVNMGKINLKKKSDPEHMPEILKKYEAIKTTWNILFLCKTCETVTDSYNNVIEHCQNHYNNMESYGIVIKSCNVCDLKFDIACFDKHKELHLANKEINKTSFTVLEYTFTSLLTNTWDRIFENLSEAQVKQIVSRSIYSVARNIKMKITQKGPTELTLYKCNRCDNFVDPSCVSNHTLEQLCSKDMSNKLYCAVCCIPFFSQNARTQHILVHKTPNINKKSFQIVTFNHKDDEQFNRMLNSIESTKNDTESNIEDANCNDTTESQLLNFEESNFAEPGIGKKHKIYKCTNCETCISFFCNIPRHTCVIDNYKKKCPECDNYIFSGRFQKHLKLHGKPDYVKENIEIVPFEPHNNTSVNVEEAKGTGSALDQNAKSIDTLEVQRVFKIYKCRCGLHFTTQNSIDKHMSLCKPGYKVSKETCSKCGLLFATDVLVSHLCNHHSNVKNAQFEIQEVKATDMVEVYKCGLCHVLFILQSEVEDHLETCTADNYEGVKCIVCGLVFHSSVISLHQRVHKRQHRLRAEDHTIVTVNKSKTSLKQMQNRTIYKCTPCDIHYMTLSSLRSHCERHDNKTEPIICKFCGLKFLYRSLRKHIYIHHEKMKYNLKDLIISDKLDPKDNFSVNMSVTSNTSLNESDISFGLDKTILESSKFKCIKCDTHFLDSLTLSIHMQGPCDKDASEVCDLCHLKFSFKSFKQHIETHSEHKIEDGFSKEKTQEKIKANKLVCQLFKCEKCNVHYLSTNSLNNHITAGVHSDPFVTCNICGLAFAPTSLERHKYVHHKIMKLKLEDITIITGQAHLLEGKIENNSIIKKENSILDECDKLSESESTHISQKVLNVETTERNIKISANEGFNGENIDTLAFENYQEKSNALNVSEDIDNLYTNTNKITATINADNNKSFKKSLRVDISEEDVSTNISKDSDTAFNTSSLVDNSKNYKVKLYKCGECNVCYLAQNTCYKHTLKHIPLDPMDYIECKFCYLQFTLTSLKAHFKKHHSSKLNLEDILIEEYQPNKCSSQVPKIDIYCAMERVQSGLISTTTDINKVEVTTEQVENYKTIESDLGSVCFSSISDDKSKNSFDKTLVQNNMVNISKNALKFNNKLNTSNQSSVEIEEKNNKTEINIKENRAESNSLELLQENANFLKDADSSLFVNSKDNSEDLCYINKENMKTCDNHTDEKLNDPPLTSDEEVVQNTSHKNDNEIKEVQTSIQYDFLDNLRARSIETCHHQTDSQSVLASPVSEDKYQQNISDDTYDTAEKTEIEVEQNINFEVITDKSSGKIDDENLDSSDASVKVESHFFSPATLNSPNESQIVKDMHNPQSELSYECRKEKIEEDCSKFQSKSNNALESYEPVENLKISNNVTDNLKSDTVTEKNDDESVISQIEIEKPKVVLDSQETKEKFDNDS